jgi:hypothetical protein
MQNDSIFQHRPISELFAIVRNDFYKFDNDGLIDEGTLVKTVMWCNDKLGISIREIREIAIPVVEFKAELPLDFEKLFFVCALQASGTYMTETRNPFDNNFDQDIIYEASLDRSSLGNVSNYNVTIKRETKTTVHNYHSWIQLDVTKSSQKHCHIDCPNGKRKGKYTIEIKDDHIDVPFRSGTLYLMYVGMMKDIEGNITFPFHPLITPYYEWTLKEKIITDAIFNSDGGQQLVQLLQLAKSERAKAWLDAFGFTTERSYGDIVKAQRNKELQWYHQYFRWFT